MYPLPPYARRVECLESTGTQWIDTGVGVAANTRIVARWTQMGVGVNQRLYGVNDGNPANMSLYINGGGAWALALGTAAFQLLPSAAVGDCTIDADLATGAYTFANGTQSASGTAASTPFASTNIIPIFARNTLGTIAYADYPSTMRLAEFTIYYGSTPVRSFVPCRILDTGYLWDEVEGKFYGNQGTGDFVLGPDVREGVLPTRLNPFGIGRRMVDIKKIEYIEANANDGTAQYIDTLVPVTTDTIVEAEWTQTGTAIQQRLFGVNDSSGKVFALYINSNRKWAVNTGASAGGVMQDAMLGDWSGSFNLGTGVCVLNGRSRSNGGTPFSSDNAIPIFARRNVGTPLYSDYPARMQLKSFKITQGGRTAFDGTPVRIGSVGYLLDKVSGQLFGNLGTGSFIVGPDLLV